MEETSKSSNKRIRKSFEPLENPTDEDITRIVRESLQRNLKVYDRLAEI